MSFHLWCKPNRLECNFFWILTNLKRLERPKSLPGFQKLRRDLTLVEQDRCKVVGLSPTPAENESELLNRVQPLIWHHLDPAQIKKDLITEKDNLCFCSFSLLTCVRPNLVLMQNSLRQGWIKFFTQKFDFRLSISWLFCVVKFLTCWAWSVVRRSVVTK